MLKTILVPVDGTHVSEAALPYAEALAHRTGAAVVIMHAVQPTSVWGDVDATYTRAVQDAEDYVDSLAQSLIDRGTRVDTAVPVGGASAWIRDEIQLRHVDLVVMATHDRAGLSRWLHGSVAETVAAHAGAPVMLVRAAEGMRPTERIGQPHPVLLVPLDGSELAEGALPIATTLATACGASVVLVGVVPVPGQLVAGDGGVVTYVEEDIEQLTSEATDYLARIRDRFPSGVRVESVVRHGSPGVQIADEAEARGAMGVVMATHGRTGLTRSLLGSVAGEVVHRGATPVVLVRPQTASAEAESAIAAAAASA